MKKRNPKGVYSRPKAGSLSTKRIRHGTCPVCHAPVFMGYRRTKSGKRHWYHGHCLKSAGLN